MAAAVNVETEDLIARRRARAVWFTLFLTLFLAANALVRWLRWTIFHGHGPYSWTPPTPFDYVHVIFSTIVPFLVLGGLAYATLIRFATTRARLLVFGIVVYVVLIILEMDVYWYKLSARHVTTGEVYIFLFEDWRKHIGLQHSDLVQFSEVAAYHAAAFVLFWVLASLLARMLPPWQPKPLRVGLLSCALLLVDWQWMAIHIAHAADNREYRAVSALHPLRLSALDGFYLQFGREAHFVRELNDRYRTLAPAQEVAPNPLVIGHMPPEVRHLNVVVLAIEGLNVRYFDQLTALATLKRVALVGRQHYSTGDATHYGILGITHGLPMLMYGGRTRPQSQYIDALNRAGYRTQRFGADTTVFGQIGEYVHNFSLPTDEPRDDFTMLPDIGRYLADARTPQFAMIYYFGTHWPYLHAEKYRRYQPEVAPDFNYSSWDLMAHRTEIVNRYRNALDELNDWLTRFLALIDLDNTILIITGDHGEEMFEHGRMSHAAGTWEGQIRTALLVHVPGVPSGEITSITSHAQIMPALMEWLGLAHSVPPNPFASSCPIAAHNNHIFRPREYVCITPKYKIHFGIRDDSFKIEFVTDHMDQHVIERTGTNDPSLDEGLRSLRAAEAAWRQFFKGA